MPTAGSAVVVGDQTTGKQMVNMQLLHSDCLLSLNNQNKRFSWRHKNTKGKNLSIDILGGH